MIDTPVPIPSAYERKVMRQLDGWRSQRPSWAQRQVRRLNAPLRHVSDLAFKVPGVAWSVDHLVGGLVRCANEIAQDTLIRDHTLNAYRERGHEVDSLAELRLLDLEEVDAVLEGLDTRYTSVTAAHGAVAGFAGFAGLIPDLVALVSLNLRATGQIATCCGYDMTLGFERTYALQVLRAASERTAATETDAPAIARLHTAQTVEQLALSGSIRGAARALGTRLVQSKMAQIVPVAGMVAGGGFNAYYTARVCETARFLYRERRLRDKYPHLHR